MSGVVFVHLNLSLPPDVDAGRGARRADNVAAADVRHEREGRHPLQLGEGARQRHLLIQSAAARAKTTTAPTTTTIPTRHGQTSRE